MNFKHSKSQHIIAWEIGLIFILWIVSVFISQPVIVSGIEGTNQWLSHHALISMRALEDWGFWKLLGASILTPHTSEFIGVDIVSLTKQEGIYLSYPSFWLVLPYGAFKFLSLFSWGLEISFQYLQSYSLVVNRLICGIVIYYLYLEAIRIIAKKILSDYTGRLIAGLGLVGWMFTPMVMQNTQNIYFSDQAVLLSVYVIFLIVLKCRFSLNRLSMPVKLMLLTASFIACGIDWYGWVSVGIITLIVLVDHCLTAPGNYKNLFSFKVFSQFLDSVQWLVAGMFGAGIVFLIQLFYYQDGFRQLFEIFLTRTGSQSDKFQGFSSFLSTFMSGVLKHWTIYYPSVLQNFANQSISNHVLLLVIAVVFIFSILFYLCGKSKDKKSIIYLSILVFLVPLTQIILLKQHSLVHSFSAFKMAMPISFCLLILPTVLASLILGNSLVDRSASNIPAENFRFSKLNVISSIFILTIGSGIVFSSIGSSIYLYTAQPSDVGAVADNRRRDLGLVLNNNISEKELVVASSRFWAKSSDFTDVLWVPPGLLWHTKRFIYSFAQLNDLISKQRINIANKKDVSLVFLALKNKVAETVQQDVALVCVDQWIPVPEKINNEVVVTCRTSKLKQFLEG